jgi:hypothetical protein
MPWQSGCKFPREESLFESEIIRAKNWWFFDTRRL